MAETVRTDRLHLEIVSSPLVQAAGIAIRLTRWWAAFPLALIIEIVAALVVSPAAPMLEDVGFPVSELALVAMHLVVLLLLFAWVRWWEKRPPASVGFTSPAPKGTMVRGFGIGVGLFAVTLVPLILSGAVHLTPTTAGTIAWGAIGPALVMIPVWFFLAAAQEALTRGFLLQVTGLQIAAWAAVLGQALLWAVVRVASQSDTNLLAALNLAIVGVALAFVALREGSLWLAIGLNAGFSWFQTSLLGVNWVGGGRSEAVIGLIPTSASWWSGGAAGVIASPMVTLAAAAVALWSFRRYQT
jgi:membrane protease YdiL (CAAX protease family)